MPEAQNTAQIIDGKAFAAGLTDKIGAAVSDFMAEGHPQPGLAVVLVGEDPASQVYVRNKIKTTKAAGMKSIEYRLDADTSQEDLVALVEKLNRDDNVDGILVQLPLPKQINADAVINTIDPNKDVDGFHVVNVGRLSIGLDAHIPCTPYGCLMLLRDYYGDLNGKSAVVIGRSNIVGKQLCSVFGCDEPWICSSYALLYVSSNGHGYSRRDLIATLFNAWVIQEPAYQQVLLCSLL